MKKMNELLSIFSLMMFLHGIHGQLTVPPSTTAVLGEDVLLECSTTETNPQFTWTYATNGQILFFNGNSGATAERYKNIVLQEGTGTQTSILNISAIQLEDEGEYLCNTLSQTDTPPTTMVTVEVASTSKEIDLININNFANYQATCDAIGSKPEETITWFLNGVQQTAPPADIVESDPGISADPLSDKRSVFKFPATLDNYNVTLVCEIGHQTASLNRQESRRVNVQNPPYPEGIVIGFTSDGSDLTVSCNTNGAVAAAIPPMDTFYIYSNGTLINKPVSDNSVTVTEPEQDTEYRCVGGNYLGNTTTTQTFEPGRTTTPPPTTDMMTSPGPNDGNETGPPSGPGGLSAGATAGIAIGAVLLIVIIVLIIYFVWKKGKDGLQGLFTSCNCCLRCWCCNCCLPCCNCCLPPSGASSTKKHGSSTVGTSNGSEKDKIKPVAAPRDQGSIQHTTDNPGQAEYAMVDRKKPGGDMPDTRGPGQKEPQGMLYADLDLSASAGHTEKKVPQNKDDVVVYSSILV